jgi:tRNA pseudouridine55 synthase
LCEDIAKKLGTIGYMKELNRVKVGDFSIENAITIDELQESLNNKDFLDSHFISLEKVFGNFDCIKLDEKRLELFLNGVCLTQNMPDGVYRIYSDCFIGTGTIKDNLLKRDIIL